jgi:hypothetical protein
MHALSHSEILLGKAAKDLKTNWATATASWQDQARQEFEKTCIDELLPAVKSAINAMNEVNRLLEQAVRECS